MNIKKLWNGFRFPKCENCKNDCEGRLSYNNLCSNVNYLKEYGEKNYLKNKESLAELKNIVGAETPTIFSFGCGLGLDYIASQVIFGDNIKYFGIDEYDWAIKNTENYKNFEPSLPKTLKYKEGIMYLGIIQNPVALCFFNSLFTISCDEDLYNDLIRTLQNKKTFYIVCDYTINNTYHMPKVEHDFIKKLQIRLNGLFKFQKIDILDGRGIMVIGKK